MRTRVVAIEDHALVHSAIAALIGSRDDMTLIATERSGTDGLRVIAHSKPDIAVIGTVAEINVLVLAERIVNDHPATKVIILSTHEDHALVQQALHIGAKAYVSKRSAAKRLLEAVAAVTEGKVYVDPAIGQKLLKSRDCHSPAKGSVDTGGTLLNLSERETDTVRLIALGYTTREIAGQLSTSLRQVDSYRSRAFEKLDLRTRRQLVRYAATRGWLSPF